MSAPVAHTDVERLVELVEHLRTHNTQLEHALASRVVIEQAKGVLAERYRIDVERAFEILRAGARSGRVRLHDLAADVVSSPRTPTPIERELVRRTPVGRPAPPRPADAAR